MGDGRPTDAELLEALRASRAAGQAEPVGVSRRPSPYRTSFPLEELELELEDGSRVELAFKRLAWDELDEQARLAKPRFLHDPGREPAVYASVLAPSGLGAPRCWGSIEPEPGRHWLFVEWVAGRELYQVGELALWEEAARWLARMHAELGRETERHAAAAPLLDHDAAFYRAWAERAREFARAPGQPAGRARQVDWLCARQEPAIAALLAQPRTVIHGEFYASNVLVANDSARPRVAPVDWELAAVGPGLSDLAALLSGGWSEQERQALAVAYGVADAQALAFARLQVAIQWLGWAPPQWVPPPGQRQDWLGEAIELAEGLDL